MFITKPFPLASRLSPRYFLFFVIGKLFLHQRFGMVCFLTSLGIGDRSIAFSSCKHSDSLPVTRHLWALLFSSHLVERLLVRFPIRVLLLTGDLASYLRVVSCHRRSIALDRRQSLSTHLFFVGHVGTWSTEHRDHGVSAFQLREACRNRSSRVLFASACRGRQGAKLSVLRLVTGSPC